MSSRTCVPLTPLILALAAIGATVPAEEIPAADPKAALEQAAQAFAGSPAGLAGDAALAEAQALYRKAQFVECRAKVEEAIRLNPANAAAITLREDVLAVLSQRDNRLQMAATWFRTLQDVRTQETAVRLEGLIKSGDQKSARGDYAGAELDFDRAAVGLKSFPYAFDWGTLPQVIESKRKDAAARVRAESEKRQDDAREGAETQAREAVRLQEKALSDKVDELLRRAKDAYGRKDFRRAEVDAWNAYELDRRREDARDLYLDARREGHDSFDDKHETERSERIARVNEEVHKSLIPQTELLVYPEDWARRTLRKPREIGTGKEEAWMAAMRDRLEQRVTFEFQDQGFEDVINFLRQVTGTNIIVSQEVLAANGGGTVTLKVKDMRFGDALKWILELTQLHYVLQDQAIYISKTQVTGAVVLKLYDVADLIQHPRDMPGRELAIANGPAGGGNPFQGANTTETAKAPDPQELVDFIKKNVSPESWTGEGAGIEQRGGSVLFISQVPEVHGQIEQLLASQRSLSSLQVAIDVRVLRVRKNYFEEIGFDWSHATVGQKLTSTSTDGYTRQGENGQINASVNNTKGPGSSITDYNPSGKGLLLDVSHSPFSFLNRDQVNVVMNAVENEGDMTTVEQPQLTCYNGQRAHAAFLHQMAYIGDYQVVTGNFDPQTSIISYGNIIDIRPVVSSDRKYVTMEVRPSSVSKDGLFVDYIVATRMVGGNNGNGNNGGTTGGIVGTSKYPIEMPNLSVHSLRSTVMIPDKASLLIGGFQKSGRETTSTGVPFLSNIPFLGRLFSRNGTYDLDDRTFYLLHTEILDLAEKEAVQ